MADPALQPTGTTLSTTFDIVAMRAAQVQWRQRTMQSRVAWASQVRRQLVDNVDGVIDAALPGVGRSHLEVLTSELLPLIDACRFLERRAVSVLAPQRLSRRDRPAWLVTRETVIERVPLGIVLILAPSNYPLFLAGVQTLQALVAGNAVLLKPGRQGTSAAYRLAGLFAAAGLPDGLLTVLAEDVISARAALHADIDKVILTGSAAAGKDVLQVLAPRLVPATMELSGHDAVIVRADADIDLVVRALLFGLRLNRGETCIAPRRIFVHEHVMADVRNALVQALDGITGWVLDATEGRDLYETLQEALQGGAKLAHGSLGTDGKVVAPVVLADVDIGMRVARDPFFCAVMLFIAFADDAQAIAMHAQCSFALGAAVFSADETAAQAMGKALHVGLLTINDLIAPSADPRIPFGGRCHSGFGVTRGAEGLLELTAPKVTTVSRGHWRPHFDPPHPGDYAAFKQFMVLAHGRGLRQRVKAFLRLFWALFYANAVAHRRRRLARRSAGG